MESSRRLIEPLAEPLVEAHLHCVRALDLAGGPEVVSGAEPGVKRDLGPESLDGGLIGTVVARAIVDELADQL
jgi:hypothetical protein